MSTPEPMLTGLPSLLGRAQKHHGSYHPGEHVIVKGFGGATVVECEHEDKYGGRVEVRYDDDGTTYHCYTSKLAPLPQPCESPLVTAPAAPEVEPSDTKQGEEDFIKVGRQVMVKGYGVAVIVGLPIEGKHAGRVKVRYPDHSCYHCHRCELADLPTPSVEPPESAPHVPAEAQETKDFIHIGARVLVQGYGVAVVDALPIQGRYAGRVRVHYPDGGTYHCHLEEILPAPEEVSAACPEGAPSGRPAEAQGEGVAPLVQPESPSLHVGDRVLVGSYGEAEIEEFPVFGKYAGRVKVRYPEGSTYHCFRWELTRVPASSGGAC